MKLTKEIKEKIIADVLNEAFKTIVSEFYDAYEMMANKLYDHIYGQYIDVMKQLPAGALPDSSNIYCYVQGNLYCVWLKPTRKTSVERVCGLSSGSKLCFYNTPDSSYIEADSELGKLITHIHQEQHNIITDTNDLRRELNSVIGPCTTDNGLMEVWPEGGKWITKHCKKPIQNLPVANTNNLNNKLCDLLGKTSPTCKEELES